MAFHGTSPASLQQIMQAQAIMESRRGSSRKSTREESRIGGTGDTMSEYFQAELEAQRQSRVGKQISKYTMWPGIGLSTLARYPKQFGVEEKVKRISELLSKKEQAGEVSDAATKAMMKTVVKAGGLGYMASLAPMNIMKQKRLAYERGLKPQLGKTGTATSAFDTLSMANRALAMPRVASMIWGGGMPTSLQGSLGMYSATAPMMRTGMSMAGMKIPAALALKQPTVSGTLSNLGMGAPGAYGGKSAALGAATNPAMASMMNMLGPIALQMGLAMYKQKKIAKITAQRKSGSAEESKLSLSQNLDAQINMLISRGLIQPGEQIRIQILRWIEAHTSVLPEIWAEQKYIREEKEKGGRGAGEAYQRGLGGGQLKGVAGVVDKAEAFMSKQLAKLDPFSQLFNFLSTGKLPKDFQEDLEQAYGGLTGAERKQARRTARERGISLDQSRLLETSSRQISDMAGSHEAKMITLMAAQFDVQRLFASEIMTIRKAGFGIPDNMVRSDDYEKSGFSKMFGAIAAPFRALGNIPGVNALMNLVKLPFKVTTGAREVAGNVWSGIRNFMSGGEDARRLLTSEEELRKEAGIYKSDQQMAYEYIGRGLPDIMEEMRFLGAVRAQLLTNIYHVLSAQLQATTGQPVAYDEKPFSSLTKKGAWSYTAGKYLNEKGLEDQQKQDQERMELALEKSFRGSGMDRLGAFLDYVGRDISKTTERWIGGVGGAIGGREGGEQAVENFRNTKLGGWLLKSQDRTSEERMRRATGMISKMETLPFDLLEGKQGEGVTKRVGRLFAAGLLQNIGQGQEFTYSPEELIEAARFRQREMRGRGRAKVVPGWMGLKQERAQMAYEQDIGPRLKRAVGIGAGGMLGGGLGIAGGLGASALTGGALLPLLFASMLGAGTGIAPQMKGELAAMKGAYGEEGEGFSTEKIRRVALGYAEMPEIPQDQQKDIYNYYSKVNPDFAKKIKDDKNFFKNVNNFPYVMMALQGDAAFGFLSGMERGGVSFTGASFGASVLGGDISPGDVKTIADLFKVLTDRSKPVPVEIVSVGKELGLSLPIHLKYPVGVAGSNVPDIANARRRKKGEGEEETVEELMLALEQQVKGEGIDIAGNKVSVFAKGGVITRTGNVLAHEGETIIPAGGFGRDMKQELAEVEAKKEAQKTRSIWEKMVGLLMNIDENTESTDDTGRGSKTGKLKKGVTTALLGLPGFMGELFGAFGTLLMASIAGFAAGGPTGALAAAGGAAMVATKTGRKGLKWAAKKGFKGAKFAVKNLWQGFKGGVAGKAAGAAGEVSGAAGEAATMGGRVAGVVGKGLGAVGRVAGKLALPLTLVMGAWDIVTDMIKGWKEEGIGGALKQVFGGDKEGGFASAFKGMGKYAVIGAGIGSVVPVLGTITGGLIGSAVGAIVGFLGQERLGKIYDFFKKWTGGDLIQGLFPGKYGKKFSGSMAFLPIVGPLAGGIFGSFVDIIAGIFTTDWIGLMKKGILKLMPNWMKKLFGIEEEKKKEPSKRREGASTGTQTSTVSGGGSGTESPSLWSRFKSAVGMGDSEGPSGGGALGSPAKLSEEQKNLAFIGAQMMRSSNDHRVKSGLVWPGSNFITSPFGLRNPSLPGASKMHGGVDMRADDVTAAMEGYVTNVDDKWGGVTIAHNWGLATRYLHMNSIDVRKGQKVYPGQKIGVAGNKGPIPGMGKHLHFEVSKDGQKIDPELAYNLANKNTFQYASDIDPSRQLSAKLSGKEVDLAKIKTEGREAAGPFGYSPYDPIEIRGNLSSRIRGMQEEKKRTEMVRESVAPSAPIVVPIPMGGEGDTNTDRLVTSKKSTPVDPELDSFVEGLFIDSSFEFGQRYKKYAYHSNVGHSFI
jgi:murein DD-endopeptidase MepM/ murein hydrolase activator NlpD